MMMLTDEDIKRLAKVFATKQDLDRFATKFEFEELKNDVFTKMDAVYKEVIAMRQEQTAHFQQHEDVNQRLDKLEAVVFPH
jgi:predicted nuclease with TOPRIM domain